jgi:hypothetical protein
MVRHTTDDIRDISFCKYLGKNWINHALIKSFAGNYCDKKCDRIGNKRRDRILSIRTFLSNMNEIWAKLMVEVR